MFTCFEAGKASFRSRLSLCYFRDVSLINFYVEQWSSARENASETAHHLKVRFQWPASNLVTEMYKAGCARQSAALHVAGLCCINVYQCVSTGSSPLSCTRLRGACCFAQSEWCSERGKKGVRVTALREGCTENPSCQNVKPSHCGCAS